MRPIVLVGVTRASPVAQMLSQGPDGDRHVLVERCGRELLDDALGHRDGDERFGGSGDANAQDLAVPVLAVADLQETAT